jgi:hypothetical protein
VEIRGTGGRTSNQPWDTETHWKGGLKMMLY